MASEKDDLVSSLMNMLGDNPEEKIGALLGSLSSNKDEPEEDEKPSSAGGGENALSLLSGLGGSGGGSPLGGLDIGMLMKMKGVMDKVGKQEDERTILLRSLKPFLSDRRKPVFDQAMKMLELSKFANVAKDLDLF